MLKRKTKRGDFHGTARKCTLDSAQGGHLSQQTHIDEDSAQRGRESGRRGKSHGSHAPCPAPPPADAVRAESVPGAAHLPSARGHTCGRHSNSRRILIAPGGEAAKTAVNAGAVFRTLATRLFSVFLINPDLWLHRASPYFLKRASAASACSAVCSVVHGIYTLYVYTHTHTCMWRYTHK